MHATLPGSTLVEVIARAVGAESELPVAEHLMSRAVQVLRHFTDPTWAEEKGWGLLSTALLQIARNPRYGVDQQLIAFTTFCRCKLTDAQVQLLAEVREVDSLVAAGIAGLELDTDLRWTVLTALSAHGAVTEKDVDSALAADRTSMGERRALTAKAALPTAQNKARVWEDIFAVSGALASNWSVVALLDGFAWTGQDALVAPFAERYPADLARLWEQRGGEVAATVTERAFPLWGEPAEVRRLVGDMLAAPATLPAAVPSGGRRFLQEGLFDLERAQKARALDSSRHRS